MDEPNSYIYRTFLSDLFITMQRYYGQNKNQNQINTLFVIDECRSVFPTTSEHSGDDTGRFLEQFITTSRSSGISTSPREYGRTSIPFAHKELKKSLEVIISKPKQKTSPLEDMFSDKAKTLKASVNAILEEIKLREYLNAYQTTKINSEICRQHTELMQLENLKDHYPFNLTKDISETKANIETNVLELEKEKRQEGLECWRDLMFLKKYLMVSLKDYWELDRKRGVLEGQKKY